MAAKTTTSKKKTTSDERTPEEIAANVERIKAETEKFRAEAAEAASSAKKHVTEEKMGLENALHIQTMRLAQEVQTRQILRQEQEQLAHPRFHNTYHYTQQVDSRTIRDCMAQMDIWHHQDPTSDMRIIFTSPGGSVIDGMALFDYIRAMHDQGHRIITGTLGYAASMAGILLQAGDERLMGPEAYLLIHQISFGAQGSYGEVNDTVKWVEKIQNRVLDIFAARAKQSGAKITRSEIEKKWKRTDWWLDSGEALKCGFVDKVGLVDGPGYGS